MSPAFGIDGGFAGVAVVPTLETMAGIYRLSREGGAASPRFQAYRAIVAQTLGLSSYNPMAGPHALEAVDALIVLDAEAIVLEAAQETVRNVGYHGPVTLALVLASPGMWTDRLATSIRHRTLDDRLPDRGLVLQWTREVPTADGIYDAAVAETVRVIFTAQHGPAKRVRAVLAREGLSLALGRAPVAPLSSNERQAVDHALMIIGDSADPSEIVALALGDDAAVAVGYRPLGLAPEAGVRWAATDALSADS